MIPGSYIIEAGDQLNNGWEGGGFTITNDNTGEAYSIINNTTNEEKDFFTLATGGWPTVYQAGSFDIGVMKMDEN